MEHAELRIALREGLQFLTINDLLHAAVAMNEANRNRTISAQS
jgi:hypothetical protein